MENNIVNISLFLGEGGLDITSFMADIPVVSSIDIEKDCIETLKANDMLGDLQQVDSQAFKGILEKIIFLNL
ncbi:hypothetical protein KQI36_10345 [Clostridium senegalense]|uniref:hypothetical protein n=1 Tax=Clostridium senegalense TaxID=1465809 RepID=UPI001C11BE76|nr:hypothetical protein [Clostridium senegalense]MBU5227038.1 hypothetical protein [Clostridium senegalense]